ncbi:MAG: 3-oxoacyl-[acyl-carrier-protein] reductase [Polyangiaceae bacterium]|nr:3-oxoacyl-[acyl-carrier-protein] reductase [Polyangiaceae bacterium]
MEFEGRTALITGGSRGIGRAIALELSARGCDVAFTYREREAEARGLADELTARGRRVAALRVDVADFAAMQQMGKELKARFGRIDMLVNNAGVKRDAQLLMMNEEDWDQVLGVNLKGAFNAAKAVIFAMMKQRSGRILNVSSVSGLIGLRGQANYSASKAGLIGFTKALAKELGPVGITVNSLALGFVETEMIADLPEQQRERYLQEIPLRRFATVDEVGRFAAFLLSDAAGYLTGQTVVMDGGLAM